MNYKDEHRDEQSEISAQAREDDFLKKAEEGEGQFLEGHIIPENPEGEKEKKVALKKRKEFMEILEAQLGQGYFRNLSERDFNSEKRDLYQLEQRIIYIMRQNGAVFDQENYLAACYQFVNGLVHLKWWNEKMVTVGMINRNFNKILQNLKNRRNESKKVTANNISQLINALQDEDPFGE